MSNSFDAADLAESILGLDQAEPDPPPVTQPGPETSGGNHLGWVLGILLFIAVSIAISLAVQLDSDQPDPPGLFDCDVGLFDAEAHFADDPAPGDC